MPRASSSSTSRSRSGGEQLIDVKLVLLGKGVETVPVRKGTTVEKFLEQAGAEADEDEVKMNGRAVEMEKTIERACTITAVPAVKGGC